MFIRKLTFAVLVAGAVLVGTVAQAGSYLLALPTGGLEAEANSEGRLAFARTGSSPVGIMNLDRHEAPVPMTVWYPALATEERALPASYSFAINMISSETAVALATYGGEAQYGLAPDLAGGPYPVVVLSHGFAISASSYAWLAEHLASHRFLVVAPHHEESLDPGVLWRSTVNRPRDIRAALAFIDEESGPGGELGGLAETETLAVIGHSYGGYTALAAGGARIDPNGFGESCATAYERADSLVFLCDALESRLDDAFELADLGQKPEGMWPSLGTASVDAVVSMAGDAAMFSEAGLAELSVPVMALGGTADEDSPFEWGTQLTYDHASSSRKAEISLEGAGHMVFAGECEVSRRIIDIVGLGFCSDPSWDRSQAHELIEHYVTAFLLAELQGDSEAATVLSQDGQPMAGVGFRSEGY